MFETTAPNSSNKLIETQSQDLLKELLSILKEKWLLSNRTGESYLKAIFSNYSSLYTATDEHHDQLLPIDQVELKHIQLVNECNDLIVNLNSLLLNTFQVYVNRMEKIKTNLFYILDLKLNVHQQIDETDFKLFLNEMLDMFRKDLSLKKDIVNDFVSRSRLSHQSQVNIMSCWLLEPFISHEVCCFKLNAYLDSHK